MAKKQKVYIGYCEEEDSFYFRHENDDLICICECTGEGNNFVTYQALTHIRDLLKMGFEIGWRDVK